MLETKRYARTWKRWIGVAAYACCLATLLPASPAVAASESATAAEEARVFPVTPTKRPDGSRWRLGYLHGGDYADYPIILTSIVHGLQTLGWVGPLTLPDARTHTAREIWTYLAQNATSDYVRFMPDGFYAPGNFDAAKRPANRQALADRLSSRKDLDLIIAMGTWAGQDMVHASMPPVPTVVASTSDPIAAGIIVSAIDSGHEHVHAKVEPDRYQAQVKLFHSVVPFKTLGLVYEDSTEGRTFGGVAAVEEVAAMLGFHVRVCHAPFNNVTAEQARAGAQACYAEIAPQSDAVYVTVHRGVDSQSIAAIAKTLIEAKVPSFSMLGSDEVRNGILMSMATPDYTPVGLFHAEMIARVFHGASPRELSQIWLSPSEMALNLETAEAIDFVPPMELLLSSDEVYGSDGRNLAN